MGKKLNRSVKEKVYVSIEVLYQEQIFLNCQLIY